MAHLPNDPDALEREALAWLARLRDPECPSAERRAFESWLGQNPRHREAYERAEAQWQALERFASTSLPAREAALRYRPIRTWRSAALAAAVLALGIGLANWLPQNWMGTEAAYQTAKGERAAFDLADGSRLELNTGSAARVRIDPWRRRVELLRGEAFFRVVHEEGRSFQVCAGSGCVEDIGTAFEVYQKAEGVLVAVEEGKVRVTARGVRDLNAGEQLAYSSTGEFLPAPPQDIAALTAWRRGLLVFRDRPLAEVAAEIGRYHETALTVGDPELARLRISGSFRTDRLDSVLDTIALTLPVQVERTGKSVVLKRAGRPRGEPRKPGR